MTDMNGLLARIDELRDAVGVARGRVAVLTDAERAALRRQVEPCILDLQRLLGDVLMPSGEERAGSGRQRDN